MFIKMIDTFLYQPKIKITTISFFTLILVGIIDSITGYELSVNILYLIPLFVICVNSNRFTGILTAIVSAIVRIVANLLTAPSEQVHYIIYWNSFIYLLTAIIFVFLTTALVESIKCERLISRIDFLTNIANRKRLFEFLEIEIYRCRRNAQCLTIVYLDCDNFKTINDQLGHQVGDQLLSSVADIIKSGIRTTDLAARLGGDEFAIVLPNASETIAIQTVSRLQNNLLSKMQKNDWAVTFSIGVVTFNVIPESVDEVIRNADELMYLVKANGKNRFEHKTCG